MYKKSIFNLVINDCFIWNTLNGAFVSLSPEEIAFYKSFSGETDDSELFSQLLRNGFIVSDNMDELGDLLITERQFLESDTPEDLFYSIAPTLRCNYHCEYCFEGDRDIYSDMSEETAHQVIRFIENAVDQNPNLKRIHVTFFGGEPLLRIDTIETISRGLYNICSAANVEFRPAIITNGRFLNAAAVQVLKELNFRSVQVSLDFTSEKYCIVRKATKQDFDETISNIVNASAQLNRVIIRINVRDHDTSDAKQLVGLLLKQKNVSSSLRFYLANIKEGDKKEREKRHSAFIQSETAFISWISEQYGERYFSKKPLAKGVSCRLSCDSNFCIGPTGELYKCDYHFGNKDFIVGNIITGFAPDRRDWYHQFTIRDRFDHPCDSCKMLPVCMGGCVNNKIQAEKIFNCSKFIEQMIRRKILSHIPDFDCGEGRISWE